MIKKILLVAVLAGMGTVGAKAGLPFVDFGLKGGINNADNNFKGSKVGEYFLNTSDKVGYHFGAQARLNLVMFHVQPEILYTHNAYDAKLAVTKGGEYRKSTVKTNTVDVPVLMGLKMLLFRVQLGPQFTLANSEKVSGGIVDDVIISKPSVSYLVGIGADLSRFTADVRYNGNFNKTKHTFELNDGSAHTIKSRDSGLVFSVGYMF